MGARGTLDFARRVGFDFVLGEAPATAADTGDDTTVSPGGGDLDLDDDRAARKSAKRARQKAQRAGSAALAPVAEIPETPTPDPVEKGAGKGAAREVPMAQRLAHPNFPFVRCSGQSCQNERKWRFMRRPY